jgi:DNA-binding NarL/FixJ family response regulator
MDANVVPLRVLVADGFEPVRRRLAQMLGEIPGVVVVGQTGGVRETLAAIDALAPGLVTLDLAMTDGPVTAILQHAPAGRPRPAIVVLTNLAGAEYRETALRLGALALLDKTLELDRIVDFVTRHARTAAAGASPGGPVP